MCLINTSKCHKRDISILKFPFFAANILFFFDMVSETCLLIL